MKTPTVRGLYMNGILSYEDYYSFLVEVIGRERLLSLLPRGFEKSQDEHLNDIPLPRWDRMDRVVRVIAGNAMWFTMGAAEGTAEPCRAWSLSDSVCVLKTLAKQEMGRI